MNPPPLIRGLLDPKGYKHPCAPIRLRETHISWILLTGPYAYKIKKPVDFGFLDFSTLEKRAFYCREELRLNRRLAPELYVDVVAVTGTPSSPCMGGQGNVLEYALRMRQFDESRLLSELAAGGRLRGEHIDALAALIARFHAGTDRAAPHTPYGNPEVIQEAARQNFAQIDADRLAAESGAKIQALKNWTEKAYTRLQSLMVQRKEQGWVRECHGDLHLGNIVLWQGQPLPFDCIEFNPMLRWIDVISETAFTVMDLAAREQRPLGFRFLNEYLLRTGDYGGIRLLRYYLVYRAMVRAKIAWLHAAQRGEPESKLQECRRYLHLAVDFTLPAAPQLLISHGFSGSGKSHACRQLAASLGALHLRSDVERKRLAGLAPDAESRSRIGEGLYTPGFSQRTYAKLHTDARLILDAGFTVIVDATFLRRKHRDLFRELAGELDVPFRILDFQAAPEVLRQRIRKRQRERRDPSEAGLEVLEHQLRHHDPLEEEERDRVLSFDTTGGFNADTALARLSLHLPPS